VHYALLILGEVGALNFSYLSHKKKGIADPSVILGAHPAGAN
jgi:hypothetical protein